MAFHYRASQTHRRASRWCPRGEISLMYLMPYETTQMVVEEILRLCFLGNLGARKPNTPPAPHGIAAGCRPRSPNAPARGRTHRSSADRLGGLLTGAPLAPLSVCSARSELCRLLWSLLSTLSNERNEVCSGRSDWRHQLISQDDGEFYKLKIAYRSLFTVLELKPRHRHPYIWTQRLSK